ncbi:uncharacterized protein DUF4834 [Ulvibacter antarcticus]|uniref:Uncharacterized protein DUF4834 n=2 Tax=Ulvibacter antarcticus TaxID=442714 RepID=A0A3L9YZJ6_9FLAO|nr:uncharacterized protein DUF4834 [Ulvibacter antarcticus]
MAFLKTILIILLVYYGVKFLVKLLSPYFMRYIARKANEKFGKVFGTNPNMSTNKEKEGSVSIDKMPGSNSKTTNPVGEYVDYEEVE